MDNQQEESRLKKEIIEWIKTIVIALLLAFTMKATIVQSYMIPTESMVPTIEPLDRVFGNRVVYHFSDPKPGDVIAFIPPEAVKRYQAPSQRTGHVIPYMKRVIGVGGDKIKVKDGVVFRNGEKLLEPYINMPPNYDMPEIKVPEDKIFVLGDNRCNSLDSHIWGFLPRKNVQAKAFFRYWPLDRIGMVR